MSKLPEEALGPKPKKKFVKTIDETNKPTFEIIREEHKDKFLSFVELYKEDRHKARVKYFNSPTGHTYIKNILFKFPNGDFEFARIEVKYGISITSKMYSSNKKIGGVSYKKGKFWIISDMNGKKIMPLNMSLLHNFVYQFEKRHIAGVTGDGYLDMVKESRIIAEFSKFQWFRNVWDFPLNGVLTFNSLLTYKLYNVNDMYRHVMKVPHKIGKLVLTSSTFGYLARGIAGKSVSTWKEILKYLDGPEHLTLEMLNHPLFMDTCKMAKTLGRKVNCHWNVKRLKQEHDRWSLEITNTLLDCEKEYDLNIKPAYKKFGEYSGYNLLLTNKDLLREGMLQHHCVGTYIDRVNNGSCAIYHIKGYTLQVKIVLLNWEKRVCTAEKSNDFFMAEKYQVTEIFNKLNASHKKALVISQFKGVYNEEAPAALTKEVYDNLIQFVLDGGFEKVKDKEENFTPLITNTNVDWMNQNNWNRG